MQYYYFKQTVNCLLYESPALYDNNYGRHSRLHTETRGEGEVEGEGGSNRGRGLLIFLSPKGSFNACNREKGLNRGNYDTVEALIATTLVSDHALVTTTIVKPCLNCHSNSVIKSSHKQPLRHR